MERPPPPPKIVITCAFSLFPDLQQKYPAGTCPHRASPSVLPLSTFPSPLIFSVSTLDRTSSLQREWVVQTEAEELKPWFPDKMLVVAHVASQLWNLCGSSETWVAWVIPGRWPPESGGADSPNYKAPEPKGPWKLQTAISLGLSVPMGTLLCTRARR